MFNTGFRTFWDLLETFVIGSHDCDFLWAITGLRCDPILSGSGSLKSKSQEVRKIAKHLEERVRMYLLLGRALYVERWKYEYVSMSEVVRCSFGIKVMMVRKVLYF